MSTRAEEVLGRLTGVRRNGRGWTARCPAHEDVHASLTVAETAEGTVLLHCHAGCDHDAIVSALGLEWKDLFGDNRPVGRWDQLSADTALRNRGLRADTIKHFRVRCDLEKQAWRFPLGKERGSKFKAFQPIPNKPKYWVPQGTKLTVYNLVACSHKPEAWLVEGEPDVWIMHQVGLAAFTFTGGAGNVPRSAVTEVAAAGIAHVHIVYDHDEAGRTGAQKVAVTLREAGVSCTVRQLPDSVGEAGDITTLYNQLGCDDAAFLGSLEALPKALPRTADETGHAEPVSVPPLETASLTQAELLLKLAEPAERFHSPDGVPYASVPVAEHRETYAIGSSAFRRWLVRQFYEQRGRGPARKTLIDVIEVLQACAEYDGLERSVFTRIGELDGKVYLDLGGGTWSAVEIGPGGWQVVLEVPVRFRRARGMATLPAPTRGGDIHLLRPYVNVSDEDFILLVTWLLAALRPQGPYPVLCLQGEQGSAKSTTARVCRALVDPSTAPLRSMPREERDLMIAAHNGWVMAFDNVSRMPSWLSDATCRLATGGGFSTRQLYTDDDEVIFAGQRPAILNGIEDLLDRDDLRDRAVSLTLPPIADTVRRDEERFWSEFASSQPAILGVLCDAVSAALRQLSETRLEASPRMADFARWATAGESAFGWAPGTFLSAYTANRQQAASASLESDAVALAVVDLLATKDPFEGTLKELLGALDARQGDGKQGPAEWPGNARALGGQLRRAAPALRQAGVLVAFLRRTNRGQPVRLARAVDPSVTTVTPVTATGPLGGFGDGRAQATTEVVTPTVTAGSELARPDVGRDGRDGSQPGNGDELDPDEEARRAQRDGA